MDENEFDTFVQGARSPLPRPINALILAGRMTAMDPGVGSSSSEWGSKKDSCT